MKSVEEKFRIVVEKNTFYYFNRKFEEQYEGYITNLRETLLVLKNDIRIKGLRKESIERLLLENENGLVALLTLTGFSNESLKRLITLIRVVNDKRLSNLTFKNKWNKLEKSIEIKEWSDNYIAKQIKDDEFFRKGIINLFFEGATIPFLAETLPLFELKKLSISKLKFDINSLIDSLVRYKVKGSYSGRTENNPETVISEILTKHSITYEKGDLNELISNAPDIKRTMDFVIPNKMNPLIVIECSFLVTTSSGQGDKSKTEISVKELLQKHYPNSSFIGFIDGIGWYVRKGDLKRMVAAYEDVFTFHKDEIIRFEQFVISEVRKNVL
ncbi:MAG: hypothetical protein FJY65_02580 [Calditrichaeota bacterium]|nr:hypothetical protein [Calditrichota bacterium]